MLARNQNKFQHNIFIQIKYNYLVSKFIEAVPEGSVGQRADTQHSLTGPC